MLSSIGKSLIDDLHKDLPPVGRIVISIRQMNTYLQVRTASLSGLPLLASAGGHVSFQSPDRAAACGGIK